MEKNNSLFCRQAVHKDRCVAVVLKKNIQLGVCRVRRSWLRLEKRQVDISVSCHLWVSGKVSSSGTKAVTESKKGHGCLKNAEALVARIKNRTEGDAKYFFSSAQLYCLHKRSQKRKL